MISPKYKLTGNLKSSQELHGNLNATMSTTVDLTNYYDKDETNELLEEKQDKLIAGDNIKIENNTISAEVSGGGSVDLTDYYNKEEVDAKLEEKQDSGQIFFIDIPSQTFNNANRYTQYDLPSEFNQKLTSNLQKVLDKYNRFGVQFFVNNILVTFYPSLSVTHTPLLKNEPTMITLYGDVHNNGYFLGSGSDTPTYTAPTPLTLQISLNWPSGIPKVTASKYGMYTYGRAVPSLDWVRSNTLTKTNTTSYTPTSNYHPATKKYVDDTIDTACGVELSGGYEDNILTVKLLNANGEQLSKLDAEIPSSSVTHYTWDKSTDEDAKMLFQSVFSAYKNGTLLDVDLEDSGKMYKLCNISQPTHLANEYWCQFRTVDWYTNGTDMVFLQTVNAVLEVNGSVVNDISVKESINQFALVREYDGTNGALPTNNTKEFVPQNDYEPATKKYVDLTHYQRISGYNSTKTQVLKNINGTLTWVAE